MKIHAPKGTLSQYKNYANRTLVLKATKWRLFEVRLPIINDPGKDDYNTTEQLCQEVAIRINCKVAITAQCWFVLQHSLNMNALHNGTIACMSE